MNRKRIAVVVGVLGIVAVGGWFFFPRSPTIHFVEFSRPGIAIFEIRNDSFSEFSFGATLTPASDSASMVVARTGTPKGVATGSILGSLRPGGVTIPPRTSIQVPVQVPLGETTEFRIGIQFKRGPVDQRARKPNKVEEVIWSIRRQLNRYFPKPEATWSDTIPLPPVAVNGHRTAVVSDRRAHSFGFQDSLALDGL